MRLLHRGAKLEDLIVVIGYADENLIYAVGPRTELFAEAPLLASLLRVAHCAHGEPGFLPWVALIGTDVAWGAFRVVPDRAVAA